MLLTFSRKEHGWQAHAMCSSTDCQGNKVAINWKIKRDERRPL
jgi:hypothetical protein